MAKLFRIVIPAYPGVNIFTRRAKKTTALGPILVATVANKLEGWQVEVIDENNYRRGPRDSQGLPDHAVLQKENPADVVGVYCGLTCTMERVWRVVEFYHQQDVKIIAGAWHAHYCPEEALNHDIDVVVHGDAELVIRQILSALGEGGSLENISGISFLKNGQIKTNLPDMLENPDLNDLPFPDFGLLRYAKIKIYPIGRIRGCNMNCEFCSVKGRPRWSSSQHLFNTVKWLRETRRAKHFFLVDDNSGAEPEGTIKFFQMISEKFRNQLHFTVQMRLEAAENTELLEVMRKAGVEVVCIGYESPVNEDLKIMRKGYLSSKMLEWTKIWRSFFWVHGMFIVGYPSKGAETSMPAREIVRCFRRFIRKASIDSVQIVLPVPLVGTGLRYRLEKERRIFPLELVSWSRYDGCYPCFKPDNMKPSELQQIGLKLMRRFYNLSSLFRILLRILFFPLAFPVDYLLRGWRQWHRGWSRDVLRSGAHILIRQWQKRQQTKLIERLDKYQIEPH